MGYVTKTNLRSAGKGKAELGVEEERRKEGRTGKKKGRREADRVEGGKEIRGRGRDEF